MNIAKNNNNKKVLLVTYVVEYTVGILTKLNLVVKGTEKTLVSIVQNMVIPLKKGYTIVKCRGQREITKNVS